MATSPSQSGDNTAVAPAATPSTAAGAPTTNDDRSRNREFYRAASFLSIWGPCRGIGDAYLSCVLSEGLGMCKPVRRVFEQCGADTSVYSLAMLDRVGDQACSHIPESEQNVPARRNCAAQFILKQYNQEQAQQQQQHLLMPASDHAGPQ